MRRFALIAGFCVVATAGCGEYAGQWQNWGATQRKEEYNSEKFSKFIAPQSFVYEMSRVDATGKFSGQPGEAVNIGGRTWSAGYESLRIPQNMLRPVGSAGGAQIFALSWDDPPYDALYTPGTGGGFTILR